MPVIFIREGKGGNNRRASNTVDSEVVGYAPEGVTILVEPGSALVLHATQEQIAVYTGQEAVDKIKGL